VRGTRPPFAIPGPLVRPLLEIYGTDCKWSGASPVSRADALLLHVHALSSPLPELRGEVLALLVKECRDPANWKRQRQLEEAALVIAPDDPKTALDLAAPLDEGRRHRAIARIEGQSAGLGPRPFFNISQTPQ
jgi:hypothetical protein